MEHIIDHWSLLLGAALMFMCLRFGIPAAMLGYLLLRAPSEIYKRNAAAKRLCKAFNTGTLKPEDKPQFERFRSEGVITCIPKIAASNEWVLRASLSQRAVEELFDT